MARGDTSRVWDYYTRDRSTPQRDLYWGGQSDLTASMAWEEDGETTIFFRKKLVVTIFIILYRVVKKICLLILNFSYISFRKANI